ncbi:Ribosomal large subunit pseudouridine synthase A [Brevibacterium casei]|uniref:RNA pseudouridylate synthase n=1 Tax=Brevibacterium casei TaxID=33889 RepID=A0A449D8V2_9MICO|nr:Ribosomal large subunit pseudouridine synthase A [Brevibacterium casei]
MLRAPGGLATHAKAHLPVPATIGRWLSEEFPSAAESDRRALVAQTPAEAAEIVDADVAGKGRLGEPLSAPEALGPLLPGQMCDSLGTPVHWDDPVIPGGFYFFHRPVPAEERIPFEVSIVWEDDDLLVVDKPHFLASTPNGRFVRESVVTRLRVDRGEPDLVAIHRLDRITAGLLILSRRPETRGRYQRLFQDRQVTKTYRALASSPPYDLDFPLTRRSRLHKPPGGRQVLEVPGEANAISRIDHLGEVAGRVGVSEYRLEPLTGKTHQLRVHMNALGLPLLGDPVYPRDLSPDPYDFSTALQLLAATIDFTDPLDGRLRRFATGLALDGSADDDGGRGTSPMPGPGPTLTSSPGTADDPGSAGAETPGVPQT